jgi:hypothetical protein
MNIRHGNLRVLNTDMLTPGTPNYIGKTEYQLICVFEDAIYPGFLGEQRFSFDSKSNFTVSALILSNYGMNFEFKSYKTLASAYRKVLMQLIKPELNWDSKQYVCWISDFNLKIFM